MIQTSTSFREEMKNNRKFYVTARATLNSGTVLNLQKERFYLSGNSIVETDDSSDFPFGAAIEKTATLSLVNDDDRYTGYDFNKATFLIYVNLDQSDGTTKIIKKGTFVVSKKPATGARIRLTLLDRMYRADKTYSTKLVFPTTMRDVLIDACDGCDLSYNLSGLKNGSFVIEAMPENTTFRAVIGYCAAIAGGNARINENDQLEIIYFTPINEDAVESSIDPTTHHIFKAINDLEYDTDPVQVTGVKLKGEGEKEYLCGAEGYVLTVENPLIKGREQEGLALMAKAVIGLKMWPLSFNAFADPTITFLDPAYVYDRKGRRYTTYLTDITFNLNGKTALAGSCKSAVEISQEYANDFVNVEQIKDIAEESQSRYQTAVQHMNELAAYSLGFYYTEVKQDDGSTIAYRHDQPSLVDSKVVYKNGIDGFFVTQDYRGTDEATRLAGKWSSGFDSNGNAVLNILYAIGINAGWINTGTFKVVDKNKNVMFSADVDTGDVVINAKTLSVTSKPVATKENLKDTKEDLVAQIKLRVETGKLISEINVAKDRIKLSTSRFEVSSQYFYLADGMLTVKNTNKKEYVRLKKGVIAGGYNGAETGRINFYSAARISGKTCRGLSLYGKKFIGLNAPRLLLTRSYNTGGVIADVGKTGTFKFNSVIHMEATNGGGFKWSEGPFSITFKNGICVGYSIPK